MSNGIKISIQRLRLRRSKEGRDGQITDPWRYLFVGRHENGHISTASLFEKQSRNNRVCKINKSSWYSAGR
jgi:hypothetical protein